MRYLVIASCVDARSGAEFEPGDEFLPEPEHDQAERLVKAGCLRPIDGDAPLLPVDAREGVLVTQLRAEIAALTDELATVRSDAGRQLQAVNETLTTLQSEHGSLEQTHHDALSELEQLRPQLAELDQLRRRVEELAAAQEGASGEQGSGEAPAAKPGKQRS